MSRHVCVLSRLALILRHFAASLAICVTLSLSLFPPSLSLSLPIFGERKEKAESLTAEGKHWQIPWGYSNPPSHEFKFPALNAERFPLSAEFNHYLHGGPDWAGHVLIWNAPRSKVDNSNRPDLCPRSFFEATGCWTPERGREREGERKKEDTVRGNEGLSAAAVEYINYSNRDKRENEREREREGERETAFPIQ